MIWFFVFFLSLYKIIAQALPLESLAASSNCSRQNFESSEKNYAKVPVVFPMTSFNCWGRYDGYYADIEVDCTIFHYCQTWNFPSGRNETVKWDFVCPLNTIFHQRLLSCVPPDNSFECQESPNYYYINKNLHAMNLRVKAGPESDYYNSQHSVRCPCESTELITYERDSEPKSTKEQSNIAYMVSPYPPYEEFKRPPQEPSNVKQSEFYPPESIPAV